MSQGRMRVLTLRAGVWMRSREAGVRPERVTHDHDVLALPSRGKDAGGEWGKAWSFKRGDSAYWYVLAHDVDPQRDFLDSEGYVR